MPNKVLSIAPDGNFTNNSTAQDDSTGASIAKLTFQTFKEQGAITLSQTSQTYKITHSYFAGVWKLLDEPRQPPLIVARKPKWYLYTVNFQMDGEEYEMLREENKPDYKLSRIVNDSSGSTKTVVGKLVPDTRKKRSYIVAFDDTLRVELPLFCYWLVVVFNRRPMGSRDTSYGSTGPSSAIHRFYE